MKYLSLAVLIVAISACKTPTELLEEGNFKSAFSNALREVKARKNIEQNIKVIKKSARMKVDEAMLYSSIYGNTGNVKDWIKTQAKLYKLLQEIGRANLIIEGKISEPYDMLCTEKKDLDYQIVEYYFDEGLDHLDQYYYENNKADARLAYQSFKECEKHEGISFFPQLADNIEDAHQKGIVYYVSNHGNIGSKLFLKPVPKDSDILPDCDFTINYGYVTFSTSESVSSDTKTKEIQVDTKVKTDTSGITTRTPIYETVSATITTKTVTITASLHSRITATNVSGQCNVKSSAYFSEESESYEEVNVSGDDRALSHHVVEKSGEPAFIRSDLERKVYSKAKSRVGF